MLHGVLHSLAPPGPNHEGTILPDGFLAWFGHASRTAARCRAILFPQLQNHPRSRTIVTRCPNPGIMRGPWAFWMDGFLSTKALKTANILIGIGIGLLLLGIGFSYSTFAPYLATLLRSRSIATAPPLSQQIVAQEATVITLLPFDEPASVVAPQALPTTIETPVTASTPPRPQTTPMLLDPTPELEVVVTPQPTATPLPQGSMPTRIRISDIRLDAPVVAIDWEVVETADGVQGIWQVPNWRAAGWHNTSALLGVPGNTVLNGHNTTYGEVFRDLYKLKEGAEILIDGENGSVYTYVIESLYILREANQPLEVRLENARYILPTTDERLTLVTCHPYGSIQNRLIVIARPVSRNSSVEGE